MTAHLTETSGAKLRRQIKDLFPETLLVEIIDGHLFTDTLKVAANFDKRHDNVLRATQELIKQLTELNFEGSEGGELHKAASGFVLCNYTDATGRSVPMYKLTRNAYSLLATGRMPAITLPAYELACGCSFASTWLATSAGKLVIDMPSGRTATPSELMQLNTGWAAALQLLTDFHADPQKANADNTLAALKDHLTQVAHQHANVAKASAPEFDFTDTPH